MYQSEPEVRRLAKNVKQAVTTEEITSVGRLVAATIDARLRANHWWPIDTRGVDLRLNPPATIVQIANLLVAGILEHRSYAQVEGGDSRTASYGAYLQAQGEALLEKLASHSTEFVEPELEKVMPIRHRASPQVHHPVAGFRRMRPRGGVL